MMMMMMMGDNDGGNAYMYVPYYRCSVGWMDRCIPGRIGLLDLIVCLDGFPIVAMIGAWDWSV